MHVTLRARDRLPSLRSSRIFGVLRDALAAAHKAAFRVVQFSVQSDHVHVVVEVITRWLSFEAYRVWRRAARRPSTAR
jgi:REP element-mobilizing transposase RayT